MLLLMTCTFVALLLSTRFVRRAIPSESMVALGVMTFVLLAFLQMGKLG